MSVPILMDTLLEKRSRAVCYIHMIDVTVAKEMVQALIYTTSKQIDLECPGCSGFKALLQNLNNPDFLA